jgi:hypothetical protein
MEGEIPASIVRSILEAVQETSGAQYSGILSRAGLARFAAELPANDLAPVATREEIAHLYQTIYAMVGEGLTRLFLRNYGRILAGKVLLTPVGRQMLAEVAAVPDDEKRAWYVHRAAELSSRVWTRQIVSEDDVAWYWTSDPCPLCSGITGATAPLCASPEVLYSLMAQNIIGQRLRIAEVECHAQGDPHCKYAFYK